MYHNTRNVFTSRRDKLLCKKEPNTSEQEQQAKRRD